MISKFLKGERPIDYKYWTLPASPLKLRVWEKLPRTSRVIPFGYTVNPEEPDWLIPVPKELELLELAKKHLKQYSYREVSAWLSHESGRMISHDGLKKRIDVERKRKSLAQIKRKYAERLEKVLRQIEILEKERVGYFTQKSAADED